MSWKAGAVGVATQERPIVLDEDGFHPWRIQPVSHGLVGHPMLQPASLVALGSRLEARGRVRTHSNQASAGTPFNAAPGLHPNRKSAAETLSGIAEAQAWMSLLNVQTDAEYRALVGQVLDGIQPLIDRHDPGMCRRAGWIFVTSPNTVTPFHFDEEHNFLLQVQGRKRVYVWDPDDQVVASEQARDRFHHRHERDLLQWHEEFRARARVFDLEPGQGAYMPSTSPHMVENGSEPSITISLTYYTDATRRDAMLHRAHALMRNAGMTPPRVGRHRAFDALTYAGIATVSACRRAIASLADKGGPGPFARYALVGNGG